jgi:hypothetical protein
MNQTWRSLVDRYRRLTARERAFAAALVALVTLFAAQAGYQWAEGSAARARDAQARAAEAHALTAALADDSYQRRLGTETGKIWRSAFVDSTLLGAQAQALLAAETLAAQASLDNAEVAVIDEDDAGSGPVHSVRVALSSDFSWRGLAELMGALGGAGPAWVLEEIEFVSAPDTAGMRVVLIAPALLEAPQ